MREPKLDLWPGVHGFRLVFTDGENHEVLGLFRSWGEAVFALNEARRLSAELEEVS